MKGEALLLFATAAVTAALPTSSITAPTTLATIALALVLLLTVLHAVSNILYTSWEERAQSELHGAISAAAHARQRSSPPPRLGTGRPDAGDAARRRRSKALAKFSKLRTAETRAAAIRAAHDALAADCAAALIQPQQQAWRSYFHRRAKWRIVLFFFIHVLMVPPSLPTTSVADGNWSLHTHVAETEAHIQGDHAQQESLAWLVEVGFEGAQAALEDAGFRLDELAQLGPRGIELIVNASRALDVAAAAVEAAQRARVRATMAAAVALAAV